jgi:Zn-dependent M28 family amino/carboxypeptidase
MLSIPNPASMDTPWARIALNRTHPSMYLNGPGFDDTAGALFSANLNPARAELLFAGTGHRFEELAALGEKRAALPRFALPLRLRMTSSLAESDVHSNNIIAVVRGSGPELRHEYVVLSAHLDHLGIGEPVAGDRINHGAMDNASGSALLLELARSLAKSPQPPKRSVLFLWLTGEEKGLLGSSYFAARPTVPIDSIVADLNVDMFLPIIPLKRVTVLGLEESDLGDQATRVAKRLGIQVQSDPEPLRNAFIRSDQYNFVRHGVPALMIDVGAEAGSAEAATLKRWRTERYHAPSDDTKQPVDLDAAGRFEELMLALTRQVADDPARPEWKPTSAFRRFAAKDGSAR